MLLYTPIHLYENMVFKLNISKTLFQLDFPAVTFCNHNRINCKYLEHIASEFNESSEENEYLKLLKDLFELGCSDTSYSMSKPAKIPSIVNPQFAVEYKFLNIFMSLNDS